MLITNFPAQLPATLPSGFKAFGYLPFSDVLPRAALLVYHGGIGTLAQAVKAGVPQLVVPSAHDQFDNGSHRAARARPLVAALAAFGRGGPPLRSAPS